MRRKNGKKTLITVVLLSALIAAALIISSINIYHEITYSVEENYIPSNISTPEPTETPVPLLDNPEMINEDIEWMFLNPCDKRGEVVSVSYETKNYLVTEETHVEKSMDVYVPYGYSASNKYDVLILLHGTNQKETFWLTESRPYVFNQTGYMSGFYIKDIIDNMMANGFCNPTIVVSPTFYLDETWVGMYGYELCSYQMEREILYDILPYIADNYSTYSVSSAREDISQARDHFGIMGASYGSMIMMESIVPDLLDVFSNFGAVSGCSTHAQTIVDKWNAKGFDQYDINFFYFSGGENDFMKEETECEYGNLTGLTDKINDSNSCFVTMIGAEHEDRVWINSLYNCLIRFFR